MKLNLNLLLILTAIQYTALNRLSQSDCPYECECNLFSQTLLINCTIESKSIELPLMPQVLMLVQNIRIIGRLEEFPRGFDQYEQLTKLDLSGNNIKSISNLNLTKLLILNLSNNKISIIKNDTFSCLSKLAVLDLSFNQIKKIKHDSFKNVQNLIDLNLSNNIIEKLSRGAFNNLKKLLHLDLHNNKITKIPKFLFHSDLLMLEYINLSHNLLTEMELYWPVHIPSGLVTIDIKHNFIKNFTNYFGLLFSNSSTLPNQPGIFQIDLGYNHIEVFDDRTIQQYGVCSSNDMSKFMNFFQVLSLNNNPIICNCERQQRLIADVLKLVKEDRNRNVWDLTCSQPFINAGKKLLEFDNCTSHGRYQYCLKRASVRPKLNMTNNLIPVEIKDEAIKEKEKKINNNFNYSLNSSSSTSKTTISKKFFKKLSLAFF